VAADPELVKQLAAVPADGDVEAVFSLRDAASSPEDTEARVRELVARVEDQVGSAPRQLNIFRNIGSFAVAAPARFVRAMLDQGEIDTATANRQSEDLFIRPVRSPRSAPRRSRRS
jgi:hypothetical protein